jgi:nicotinamidase-related amidase
MVSTSAGASRTALLLVDYQVALCEEGDRCRMPALAAQVRERGVLDRATGVLGAAREAAAYVVHVRLGFDPTYELRTNRTKRWDAYPANRAMLADSAEAQTVAVLAPQPGEPVVVKGAVDPFVGTPLANMLLGNGIRAVAIAGVATNLAVESGVRHAADAGFDVTVLEDLCASFAPEAHAFSVGTILPMFATVASGEDWVATLMTEA